MSNKFSLTALLNAKATLVQHRNQRISEYYKNPKVCLWCNKIIPYEKQHRAKFCSQSCAAHFNNAQRIASGKKRSIVSRQKTSESLKNYYAKYAKPKYCRWCGALRGHCERPEICSHYRMIKSMIKYFGFNANCIGTCNFYKEFERCKDMLYQDYWKNNLSLSMMAQKYNFSDAGSLGAFLKNLGIPLRKRITAVVQAHTLSNRYHCGYHVDWEGNKWFFRSSYEEIQMKIYDLEKIHYKVEAMQIPYYDTVKQKERIAIPDFYLPITNEIVEIKSSYTYDEQNMKDKFKAYMSHGYKPKLILDFKEQILSL